MLEITRLFPLLAALGCAVCALTVDVPVELVELVGCCVLAVVVVVVVAVVVVDAVVVAIALFASNPLAKYNVPFVHDNGCAVGRLA